LRDFVTDFKTHGKTVLEQVRRESPSKYLELSAKLAGLVTMLKPASDPYATANSPEEIAMKLLRAIGVEEEEQTPDMIRAAVAANDIFTARLEQIRDAANGTIGPDEIRFDA
jgi:hypothetical protein